MVDLNLNDQTAMCSGDCNELINEMLAPNHNDYLFGKWGPYTQTKIALAFNYGVSVKG